jgi:hypothetical protein
VRLSHAWFSAPASPSACIATALCVETSSTGRRDGRRRCPQGRAWALLKLPRNTSRSSLPTTGLSRQPASKALSALPGGGHSEKVRVRLSYYYDLALHDTCAAGPALRAPACTVCHRSAHPRRSCSLRLSGGLPVVTARPSRARDDDLPLFVYTRAPSPPSASLCALSLMAPMAAVLTAMPALADDAARDDERVHDPDPYRYRTQCPVPEVRPHDCAARHGDEWNMAQPSHVPQRDEPRRHV